MSDTVDTTALAERLAAVRARIAATGRAADDIVVVAVTKGFGAEAVEAAAAIGLDAAAVAKVYACTACSPEYFSWRARGEQQRQAAVIWR